MIEMEFPGTNARAILQIKSTHAYRSHCYSFDNGNVDQWHQFWEKFLCNCVPS